MFVNKKVLAAAIVGSLFAAGNAAAVDLSAATPAAAKYAKEITATAAAPATLSAATGTEIKWESGYAYSPGEVRYVRVELTGDAVFDTTTAAPTVTAGTAGTLTAGSVNGLGTKVVTFSVTAATPTTTPASPGGATADTTITLPAVINIGSTSAPVSVAVSLYDQPSQAQAGGATGRISGGSFSGPYLNFVSAYKIDTTPYTATASVESTPAFSKFKLDSAAPLLTATFAPLTSAGAISATGALDKTGNAISSVADVIDLAHSTVKVDGDFSLAVLADSTYDLTKVQLGGHDADAVTATSATFPGTHFGYFSVAKGQASTPIQASAYTATFTPTAMAGYTVSPTSGISFGGIVRDGTELQAPLVQIPGGWIARLALTNTGSVDRPYTIKFLSETGVTLGTANLTGTVPKSGTKVIDLTEVLTSSTATGSLRGTAIVNVAGPEGQIEGLYQIVNPATGALSNHVLIHNGSN